MSPRPLLVAACIAALAGCGGEERLGEGEYKRQANATCRSGEAGVGRIPQPTEPTGAAFSKYFADAADAAEGSIEKFGVLRPPDGLQDDHDAYVKANRESVKDLRALAERLKGVESPAELRREAASLQREIQATTKESSRIAKEIGLAECE